MILIAGLGPMGASIGLRLLATGHDVAGLDLAADRAERWALDANEPAWCSFGDVDWGGVDSVVIAVRTAEQAAACGREIAQHIDDHELNVYIVTTLSWSDAPELIMSMPEHWRVFEAPVSGGPQGARNGSLSVFLAGPELEDFDRTLFAAIADRQFRTSRYGQPALLKLLNNTLGAYNAIATAHMVRLACELGVDPRQFVAVVGASSGQSWMSDNFANFHHELLFKDVRLLLRDVGSLPEVRFDRTEHLDQFIGSARKLL